MQNLSHSSSENNLLLDNVILTFGESNVSYKLHCKRAFKGTCTNVVLVRGFSKLLDARPPGQTYSDFSLRPSQQLQRGVFAAKKDLGNVSPVTFFHPPLQSPTSLNSRSR